MKKIALLIALMLFSILLIVSCGESTMETTTAAPIVTSAFPASNTTQAAEIKLPTASTAAVATSKPVATEATTVLVIVTQVPTTATTPKETAKAPATETIPKVTTKAPVVVTTPKDTTTVKLPVTTVPETSASPITYTAKSWMGALPDATYLNDIAIPGTHDSGATKDLVLSGTAKCQTLSIADQLNVGVRFFDIRLRRVNGALHVYHGDVDQNLTFDAVLDACYKFLAENPSEVLIMCIKEEASASGTNDAFDTMVAAKIKEKSEFWHTNPAVPTLGEVRGKIVLMRRYSTSGSFGINASSGWSDNTTFTMNTGSSTLSVQDYYNNSSADAKWSSISSMFQKMQYKKNVYYLNYTSGYKTESFLFTERPNINTIKDAINPKLIEYLKTSPDFVGVVVVDFVTAEIASLIYEVNFK